jgi:hypothetical protein
MAISAHRPVASAAWSFGVFVMGAIGVTAYTSNPWLLVPVAFGGATGTYFTVRHARSSAHAEG